METIGNPELESEYIASLLLRSSYVSEIWSNLKLSFSALNKVDVLNLNEDIEYLENYIVDSNGLIKDSEVSNFIKGNCKDVYNSLLVINNKSLVLLPLLKQAYEERLRSYINTQFNNFESVSNDVYNLTELIDITQERDPEIDQIQKNYMEISSLQRRVESIIPIYGSSDIRQIALKNFQPKSLQELKNYVLMLQQSLPELELPSLVSYKLSEAIQALTVNTPIDELDPFKIDRVMELFYILSYPKKYYTMCISNEIIDTKLGEIFQIVYSQFFSECLDYFLSEANSLEYEKEQSMRQCLGIPEDFSDLTTICSSYIKLGYTL